jgi:hypothetical protein
MDHVEGLLRILLAGEEGQSYLISYISSFYFIHSLFEFYGGEEGKHSMMDPLERQGRLLVALDLY